MANPILDESMILLGLSDPVSVVMINQLQTQAWMALTAAYDRKIERGPFIEVLGAAMALNNNLGRVQVMTRVREVMDEDGFTKEGMDGVIAQLIGYSEINRLKLYGLMDMVARCPTSFDQVS